MRASQKVVVVVIVDEDAYVASISVTVGGSSYLKLSDSAGIDRLIRNKSTGLVTFDHSAKPFKLSFRFTFLSFVSRVDRIQRGG